MDRVADGFSETASDEFHGTRSTADRPAFRIMEIVEHTAWTWST